MCVTHGELAGTRVTAPTFRAVAPDSSGDAAAMRFIVRGDSATTRALASGQDRRQLGLKLRAGDGCNLVYVMWRLDPKPQLEVSVKRNPGARTAQECGADGYTKVKLPRSVSRDLAPVTALDDGLEHELRAAIVDDTLYAWVDDRLAWRGVLPAAASELSGPAGVRSDNLDVELVSFSVDRSSGAPARCEAHERARREPDT